MNAIIKIGGKQYTVTEGSEIYIEKIDAETGVSIEFNQVLMLGDKIGNPFLANASVSGEIIKHGKQKKIKIFTYTSKSKSTRKRQGHRQPYTLVKITKVA